MKQLLSILILCFTLSLSAQTTTDSQTNNKQVTDADTVILECEVMPKFRKGDLNKFRSWVLNRIQYPESSQKKGVQGGLVVDFVIEKDGRLSNIEFLQYPDDAIREEVYRVLSRSPKWTPGEQDGKLVRVKYRLPMSFAF